MGHDVFISYSKADKVAADAACAILEQEGVRCWIAPRDIRPGVEWGEAIVDGIAGSKAFVVVFSADSNESPQVRREVERAVSRGLSILPVRVEDVQPTGSMEYFLSNSHWLDAITPPLDEHLHRLADSLKGLLDIDTGDADEEPAAEPEPAEWFYAVDGSPIGPMTRSDLEGKIKGGEIGADVRVLKTGEDKWTRVRKYPGLNSLLPVQLPPIELADDETAAASQVPIDVSEAPWMAAASAGSGAGAPARIPYLARRIVAAVIDFPLVYAVAFVGARSFIFFGVYPITGYNSGRGTDMLEFTLLVCGIGVYFAMFEWSRLGATPGKLLAGLRVRRIDGRPLDFRTSVWRTLTKAVSLVPFGAGLYFTPGDRQRRTLYDKVSATQVVEKAEILDRDPAATEPQAPSISVFPENLSYPARRLAAAGVDFSLPLSVALLVAQFRVQNGYYYVAMYDTLFPYSFIFPYALSFWFLTVCWLVLYFVSFEVSPLGATPGKLLMRLRVEADDGATVDFLRSVRRTLAKFRSIVPFGTGLSRAKPDNAYRTFHDKMAGTVVVEKAPKT